MVDKYYRIKREHPEYFSKKGLATEVFTISGDLVYTSNGALYCNRDKFMENPGLVEELKYKILGYGTLRSGDYNFERMQGYFGEESIKKIGEVTLPNFKMYDLGHYPTIIATVEPDNQVVFDILEVNHPCYNFIVQMERGAGYQEIQVNVDGYGDCYVYIYLKDFINDKTPVIKSGDWFKHKQIEV